MNTHCARAFLAAILFCTSVAAAPASWELVTTGNGSFVHGIAFDPTDPTNIYVGTWENGMYISDDGGQTWEGERASFTTLDGGIALVYDMIFDPADPDRGVAITRGATYTTTDAGALWHRRQESGTTAPLIGFHLVALPNDTGVGLTELASSSGGGRFYVYDWATDSFSIGAASGNLEGFLNESTLGVSFTLDGELLLGHSTAMFRSLDLGETLARNELGLPDTQARVIVADPSIPGVALCAIDAGLYRQTSVGGAWTPWGQGLPVPVRRIIHHPRVPSWLFATTNVGVYQSTDRGATWTPMTTDGMPHPVAVDLEISPHLDHHLYATANREDRTDGGLYRIALDLSTSVESPGDDAVASTPRPNPFSARTTIAFSLARAGHVRIDVFDVTGRRVDTVLDGRLDAGTHAPVWNGRDAGGRALASGVYFYRITRDGAAEGRGRLTLRR